MRKIFTYLFQLFGIRIGRLMKRGYGFRVTWDIPGPKTIFAEVLVDGKKARKDNILSKNRTDKLHAAIRKALEDGKTEILKWEINERVTLIVGFVDDETKGAGNKASSKTKTKNK